MPLLQVKSRPPHPAPYDGLFTGIPVVQDIWELRNRFHQSVGTGLVDWQQANHKATFQRLLNLIDRATPLEPETRELLTKRHTAFFGFFYDLLRKAHWYV